MTNISDFWARHLTMMEHTVRITLTKDKEQIMRIVFCGILLDFRRLISIILLKSRDKAVVVKDSGRLVHFISHYQTWKL